GSNIGSFDLEKTTELNYRCNELGLDTISTGGTLACAMEMSEEGIWSKIDGFGEDVKKTLDKIAYREGVGDELADGSKRLCEKYGCSFSMTVKGMELPAYDPRGAAGQALSFATSNRGGCHLRGYMIGEEIFGVPKLFDRFKTSGKAQLVKRSQERNAYLDSLIVCKFSAFALDENFYSRFMQSATGEEYTVSDLHGVGERIYNLERLFNVKAGFERKDDRLPDRFEEPLEKGASSDNVFDMESMLNEYYEVMGWNENGVPERSTLESLDIQILL
ncbi:MAG: aldehyde ferredoxin oxidoreductase C-terminal domain-containing protein, partial [Candidatus Thermoplasmatota archaeon]